MSDRAGAVSLSTIQLCLGGQAEVAKSERSARIRDSELSLALSGASWLKVCGSSGALPGAVECMC